MAPCAPGPKIGRGVRLTRLCSIPSAVGAMLSMHQHTNAPHTSASRSSLMPRLTITLSEERQRAVKEAAARRGITITALIDESLERAGVRTSESARQILARARAKACLLYTSDAADEEDSVDLGGR